MKRLLLVIAALFCLFGAAAVDKIRAATFTVTNTNDSGAGSLRQALADAEAIASDDIIVFAQSVFNTEQVIKLQSPLRITKYSSGSITINGPGANLLTISGNNQTQVIYINSDQNITINALTIANGFNNEGGGIQAGAANLTINDSVIKNNSATFEGGGIYGGNLILNRTTVSGNFSGTEGGGIWGNRISITDSTVSNNTANSRGGGFYIRSDSLTVTNSTINENKAIRSSGGGIFSYGDSSTTVSLTNSTISGNIAPDSGGGITVERGTLNLINSTVAFNSSNFSGGIQNNGQTVNARNTLIARNTPIDFSGALNSQGYNLIGNITRTTISGDTTGNQLNVDPLLLPLGNYGGATQTHALNSESPAIDAGDPVNPLATDQRAITRPIDGNNDGTARTDIGAVESGILVTNINDSGSGSLRQAITEANSRSENDEIRFSNLFDDPQTITLTSGELIINNNGTLIINGTGADKLTISGNNQSRAFFNSSGATTTITNLAVKQGKATNGVGGGIFNAVGGTLSLFDLTISGNISLGGDGGGIASSGILILNNSLITDNTTSAGDAGGVSNLNGNLTIRDCRIIGNRAGSGGGIRNNGKINIINSTISGNTANSDGGGLYHFTGDANLINSTVSGNTAKDHGGGIYTSGTVLNVFNSTISNNTATTNGGGGIIVTIGVVNLTNATIAFNSANDGGGILNGLSRIVNSRNTIIARNTATNSSYAPDFSGTLVSQGYNLIGSTTGVTITGETTGNKLNVNPLLLPLGNNGGSTQTHALQDDSPAIDAASPLSVSTTDQRGFNRKTDGNGDGIAQADIGAYELSGLVTNTNDTGAGSFRQAILDARAGAGDDEIRFSSFFNTAQTINLTSGYLFMGGSDAVVINGSGANLLTLSGNNQDSVFYIGVFGNLTLNGVTITGGYGVDGGAINNKGKLTLNNSVVSGNIARSGGNNPAAGGGGIFNDSGTLILTNSVISNNSTMSFNGGGIFNNTGTVTIINSNINNNRADSEGGGIYNLGGTVNMTNSTVSNNTANRSGGIRNESLFSIIGSTINGNTAQQLYGGIYNGGTLLIDKSVISENKILGSNGDGGGLFNLGTTIITASTISGNRATRGGGINNNGGTNNDRGRLSIINSTISGNTATTGGGIYTVIGIVSLSNSTIAFNSANSGGGIGSFNTALDARNTIIARNAGATSAPDISGTIKSNGYNLIGNTAGSAITGETTTNLLNVDPLLDPLLRNNGGATRTHSLRLNSPALDAGSSVAGFAADQRGLQRPFDIPSVPNATGDGSDIGAFERQASDITIVTQFDYEGDGRADVSVFRPNNGAWYISRSSNNSFFGVGFGQSGDVIAPADFDGDGRTDISVFRQGFWYRLNSSTNQFHGLQFGVAEDVPVPADYDGDGRADIAVFRPSNSTWYRLNSSNNEFVAFKWGTSGDKPLVGDFDGDGKSDYAVFRPSAGAWYIFRSSDNSFFAVNFGVAEDIPTPADYDGDGKTDVSVFRPSAGSWYRLNSSNNQFVGQQFGISEDKPVAADYDGDGKADIAVFRPSAVAWYIQRSTSGFFAQQFGSNGDIPTPAFLQQL